MVNSIFILLQLILIFCFLHISCSQEKGTTNTQKMYHSDANRFATVTISVLDSKRASEIKDLMHYYESYDESVFEDYTGRDIFNLMFTVDIENNFGGSINNLFDMKLSCEINGIEKKLFEYELLASSKRLSRHLGVFYELDNADKVTLLAKPKYFFASDFIPNYEQMDIPSQINEENELKKNILQLGKYNLLYKMIIEPGVEGFTDFTVSRGWIVFWDNKDNEYKTRIK